MNWTHHAGGCEYWQADGWFVQQLANSLWICGPNPADAGTWTHAALLYVSREDAMRACERRTDQQADDLFPLPTTLRSEQAPVSRAAEKAREWLS